MLLKDAAQKLINTLSKKEQKTLKGGSDNIIIEGDLNL